VLTVGQGATRIPVRSLWLLLIYASDLLAQMRTEDRERILAGDRDNDLIDAIAEVLVIEVERRLRRQLTVHYRQREADLTRVRGRIDHLRTATHQLFDQGRIACRFDELSIDSPRNRFVADTLIYAATATGTALAHRCRTAAFRMHRLGVTARAPSRAELSKDRVGHHDSADRRMLDAAHLLRAMAVPAHQAGAVDLPVLIDDDRVHRTLFEAAVRGFLRHTLAGAGWDVRARQQRWTAMDDGAATFLPIMRTDVTLDHQAGQRRIVVETKFTDALVDRDGKTTIKTGYLYQLYAYLASQAGRGDPVCDSADGVLLFVKTDNRSVFTGEVTVQQHRLRFLSVDLTTSPDEIRARWLQCIAP
jgi:5-methylcytosine-specific restriction enzyme subunit McrC